MAGLIVRQRDGQTYLTTTHVDAITREHALSLSAAALTEAGFDAEYDNEFFMLDDGAKTWYVTWRAV